MRWGAVASVGFACLGRWEFKGFGVQALVLLALAAIVFVVRGPFFGHVLFCAVGLTRRSSGPAFCGPLILSVSRLDNSGKLSKFRINTERGKQ